MCVFLTFNINLIFSILFFLTSIIIFFITYKLNKKSKNYFSAMYESRNKLNKFLIEKTSMPYEIKVHNSKKFELLKMNYLIENYSFESFKSNKNIGFLMMFQIFLIGLFLIFFMLVSVYLFQKGNLTSGSFVLISSYIIQLTMPFIMVSQSLMQLNGHFISIQKLNYYFDLDKDYLTSEPELLNSNILFSFIDASFNLGDKIIYDFNFEILPNKTYAIIGKTGSGKTSFVNFLLGTNKINSGKILYKNLDISKHYSEGLFSEMSFVSQNPIIISGSLKDNLIYNSNLNIDDSHITYLLDLFGLNSILEDNKININDSIDDIYKNFSGGEMQRISIIRSLLKKPKVLILDEPTSSLDQTTGLRVINYLKTQIPSIIIITHSQYCIDLCDEVINIEDLKDLFS